MLQIGQSSDTLKEATVHLMSLDDCEQCFNQGPDRIVDGMTCAGVCGNNVQDTCQVISEYTQQYCANPC